jgi:hypothetical protein
MSFLNLKEKKKPFLFLNLLRMAAEILTMCCFFGAAWVRPCCIGMIRVDSYEKGFFLLDLKRPHIARVTLVASAERDATLMDAKSVLFFLTT